jgi:hypothetical protein
LESPVNIWYAFPDATDKFEITAVPVLDPVEVPVLSVLDPVEVPVLSVLDPVEVSVLSVFLASAEYPLSFPE